MKEAMLIVHFIGLAMGVGTSFGFMFLGIAGSKLDPEERLKFGLNALALTRMGHIGLFLLILSGGYMMTPHWQNLMATPLLLTKLVLVVVLIILISVVTRIGMMAKKENSAQILMKTSGLGKLALLVSLAIIVLAVLHFG